MAPVTWFIIGLALAALEIVIPGFVIFWFGISGVLTGILTFIPFIGNSLPAQIAIFVVLSGIMVFTAQKTARRLTRHSPERVGSERLHDARGVVTERINPPAMGMVKVFGETWRAESERALDAGTPVRVREVVGNHLVVVPAEETGGNQ